MHLVFVVSTYMVMCYIELVAAGSLSGSQYNFRYNSVYHGLETTSIHWVEPSCILDSYYMGFGAGLWLHALRLRYLTMTMCASVDATPVPNSYPHFHLQLLTSPVRIIIGMYFHEIPLNKFSSAISVTSILCCVPYGHWCRWMTRSAVKHVWQVRLSFRINCKKGCYLTWTLGREWQCTCSPYTCTVSKIQGGALIQVGSIFPLTRQMRLTGGSNASLLLLDGTLIVAGSHWSLLSAHASENPSPSHCLLLTQVFLRIVIIYWIIILAV